MKIYCFDIEATDKEEILELSIYDRESMTEIFHSYFRPHSKAWPDSEKVHHISPDFVKDKPQFSSLRDKIQAIVDEADYLAGFAVDNDLRYLRLAGIRIPDDNRIIEARELYWYCHERGGDKSPGTTPSLITCANNLGIMFDESKAHSASVDTLFTLKVINSLAEDYRRRFMSDSSPETNLVTHFKEAFAQEVADYNRRRAHGFITLEKCKEGFRLKHRSSPSDREGAVSVEVESRFLAIHEIREKFQKKSVADSVFVYRLKEKDLEWFRAYSNRYEAEREAFYRHLYNSGTMKRANLDFRLG